MHDHHLGTLGQQGSRFRIIAEKGRSAQCPPGTSTESSGRLGTGQQYAWCYRPPVFAPPPVTTTTITVPTRVQVSPSLQTAISPMISPVMGQQMASPGATQASQPTQIAPTPMTRQTGITGRELQDILAAQAAARKAEDEARERKRTAETDELRRQMATRSRVQDEIAQAQRADTARRIDAERFAREQSELAARESAAALPPPPSFAAPSPLQAPIQAAAPVMQPMLTEAEMTAGDVTVAADGEAPPWMMIALVAAGIGAVVLLGGKKGKRRMKR